MYPFISIGGSRFGLSSSLEIPSYYFAISIALIASLTLYYRRVRGAPFDQLARMGFLETDAIDLAIVIMISGFIGGRLMHVLYELPQYYAEHPLQILQFWMGGFVFYGGLFASLVSAWIWILWMLRKNRFQHQQEKSVQFKPAHIFALWGDLVAPSASLSYLLGRVGCLLEGCCFGKFSTLPWAIQLRHPTPLYAILSESFVFLILTKVERSATGMKAGSLFLIWLFFHSGFRIFMELFRDDFRGWNIFGLSISTVISVVLMTVAISIFSKLNRAHRETAL